MVGDRLDTDILFGKSGGVATLLVLTGVTSNEDLADVTADRVPDFVTGSIGDLAILSK
jgi:4-nitrophenyl phosphatase